MHIRAELPEGINSMKRMLVIGNGFDVAHGIPSKYIDFREWLENESPETIEKMGCYFPDVLDEDNEWWNDFERNLDKIDAHEKISECVNENYPDCASDDFRDRDYHTAATIMEEEMKQLYQEIQQSFESWIMTLDLNKPPKFNLRGFDFFLTFNYTDTLQRIYGINSKKIIYIHGQANVSDRLIIGHNAIAEHYKPGIELPPLQDPPDNLDSDDISDWYDEITDGYIATSTREAAEMVIRSFRKPTVEIIDSYRLFFPTISRLKEISFYGFSFADVDMPYINRMALFTDDEAIWKIYYYNQNDFERAMEVKKNLTHYKFKINVLPTSSFPSFDTIQPPIPGLYIQASKHN